MKTLIAALWLACGTSGMLFGALKTGDVTPADVGICATLGAVSGPISWAAVYVYFYMPSIPNPVIFHKP